MKIKELHILNLSPYTKGMLFTSTRAGKERLCLQTFSTISQYKGRRWFWVELPAAFELIDRKPRPKGPIQFLVPMTPNEVAMVENAARRVVKKKVKNKMRRLLQRRRDGQTQI